jgi:hypothetical protein
MKTVAGSSVKQTNKYRHIKLNRKYQIFKNKISVKSGTWAVTVGRWTLYYTVSMKHDFVRRCRCFARTHAHNSIYYWTELICVSVLFYQYNDNVSMMCLCMFCLYVYALFFTIISV